MGEEVHEDRDQFFRFEQDNGEVWIDGVANLVKADDGVIVPAGAKYNVINTGSEPLRLYTIYGPQASRRHPSQDQGRCRGISQTF
ncbi:cupin domain-containing protein [Litoreibacter arenae]|uniref:cupin domain-containing protein n=1 Tax=Litoreibacter arenae TaxID=491388 RepID=UPI001B80C316